MEKTRRTGTEAEEGDNEAESGDDRTNEPDVA